MSEQERWYYSTCERCKKYRHDELPQREIRAAGLIPRMNCGCWECPDCGGKKSCYLHSDRC